MNTGDKDVHKIEIDIENVPDFTVTSKLSSSNTFYQTDKKVRNELLCLLVA